MKAFITVTVKCVCVSLEDPGVILALQQGGIGCSLTPNCSRVGAAASLSAQPQGRETYGTSLKTPPGWARLCEGDGWLAGHQAGLVIRRLTAPHPERNGREAELGDHPSELTGPAELYSEMEERQGDSCEVGEVWAS